MGDIKFSCRICAQHLSVDEQAVGWEIRCPSCGATQSVPLPSDRHSPKPVASAQGGQKAVIPEFAHRDESITAEFKYAAFISYRHVEPDRTWAKWLHAMLETYRVPARLVRERGLPARLGKVFRDEEELPASADLSREIEYALQQSRILIVVCSPRTPYSDWVNAEVMRFREMGRHDQILALLIEGAPAEAFPRSLREIRRTITDVHGLSREQIDQVEPLAADVRPMPHEKRSHIRRLAKLRVLACILGIPFDDLRQRERERRIRQRWQRVALIGLALLLALLTGLGVLVWRWQVIEQALKQAEEARQAERTQRLAAEQAQKTAEDARQAEARQKLAAEEQQRAAQKARESESLQAQAAQQATEEAKASLYFSQISQAAMAVSQRNYKTAEAILSKCPTVNREWEWYRLKRLCHMEQLTIETPLGTESVAWHPKSNQLASVTSYGRAALWDANSGKRIYEVGPEGYEQDAAGHIFLQRSCAWSPDGRALAIGGGGYLLNILESTTGRLLKTLDDRPDNNVKANYINGFTWSPDGTLLASAGGRREIRVWYPLLGRLKQTIPVARALNIAWSPVENLLAVRTDQINGNNPSHLECWEVSENPKLKIQGPVVELGDNSEMPPLVWSPDGRSIATRSGVNSVLIWKLAPHQKMTSGKLQTALLTGHTAEILGLAWSPDGQWLASVSKDRTTRIWDAASGAEKAVLGTDEGMLSVAWRADSKQVITAGLNSIKVWELAEHAEIIQTRNPYPSTAWSPDGKCLAVFCAPKEVNGNPHVVLYDVLARQTTLTITGMVSQADEYTNVTEPPWWGCKYSSTKQSLAWSPNGRYIAFCSADRTIRIADAASGAELKILHGHDEQFTYVMWSPDGKRLITSSRDQRAIIWDFANGAESSHLDNYQDGNLSRNCWSPDGKEVVTIGSAPQENRRNDLHLHLWAANDGQLIQTFKLGKERNALPNLTTLTRTAWSPDGKRLAVAGHKTLIIDRHSGRALTVLKNCSAGCISWSPNGKRVVTAGSGEIKIWDSETGREILTVTPDYHGLASSVYTVDWSPDGHRIAVVDSSLTATGAGLGPCVRIIDATPLKE